jgi:hypothetical protein
MRQGVLAVSVATVVALGVNLVAAQDFGAQSPTAVAAVKKACDAAGGLDAYRKMGILQIELTREEITQDGHTSSTRNAFFFVAPGPTPGRLEVPDTKVIAGDDGNAGWAVLDGKPDTRPSTQYMVKRLLHGDLFPLLLPFSLTWEGVNVTSVEPAEVDGKPTWRLKVQLARNFFFTPQIGTLWTIDLDRQTSAVVRAESPATDIGKGMVADGMRFAWDNPVKVGKIWLRGGQRVEGVDQDGNPRAHNRIDKVSYKQLPPEAAKALFANPIPPEQRPKLPIGRPPQQPAAQPKS